MFFKPLIFIYSILLFLSGENIHAQNSLQKDYESSIKNSTHYPRIEVYSEIDKGDSNAGNGKWTDPNGKTVYGGKRDYRPNIVCETHLLDKKQLKQLLNIPLRWLPYFGEHKDSITLNQYFEAAKIPYGQDLYNLLPKNLNHYLSKQLSDDNYQFYKTLLAYEHSFISRFIVVWLDEKTWYVDDMYYSTDGGLSQFMTDVQKEIITEGEFKDFLRISSVFQQKTTEGFNHLKLNSTNNPIPLDKVVLQISLSPGMPNTHSFNLQFKGDGSLTLDGLKPKKSISPIQLTSFLLKAEKINWQDFNLNLKPKPPVHDGQTLSMMVWKKGHYHRIEEVDLNANTPISEYVKMVLNLFEEY